ncbi:transporter family protein [Pontibacter roseus]|uniref:hypothetical protein n=1 Tax=Pontibacter roseus TaxID=336989 RepID=UPI00035C26CF|nr:hypothetical protein [Pontibacter roseus]
MKKLVLLALALLSINISSEACDKGCTMGGSYMGILPQFHKHFVGVRYSTRSFTTTATHGQHVQVTDERFATAELWGRFNPVKNVQLFAFLPYVLNAQTSGHSSIKSKGFGDVTLMANYSLLNTGDSLGHTFKHTLQLGGGVKLATGNFQKQEHDEQLAANMQPGTGSTDYMVNGIYTIRYKQLGLSNDFTYRFNTENSDGYQFGDRLSTSSNVFYWQNVKGISLLPSAGVYYEHAKGDRYEGATNAQKGGDSFFTNLGLSVYVKNIAVGGTLQLPVSSTEAHHHTEGNSRSMVSLTYMF